MIPNLVIFSGLNERKRIELGLRFCFFFFLPIHSSIFCVSTDPTQIHIYTTMSNKRSWSPSTEDHIDQADSTQKRVCIDKKENDATTLLSDLSQVLNTIKSTPNQGEISAEVMETFRILLQEIDQLPADESNVEAQQLKLESELCLESWFDDLLTRLEEAGELNLEDLESLCANSDDEDDGNSIAFAMAQGDEEDEEEEEIIIVDDEGSEVGSSSQALAVL